MKYHPGPKQFYRNRHFGGLREFVELGQQCHRIDKSAGFGHPPQDGFPGKPIVSHFHFHTD
jgi:hypothetical protein